MALRPDAPPVVAVLLGYIGVGFFFVLSGFILIYSYHDAFREGLRASALRAFYAARVARVVPLHLVAMPPMILCLAYLAPNPVWTPVDVSTRVAQVAAQAVLLQSWIPVGAIHFGGNGPSWSISVEAFFYAAFPFVAFALLRAFRAASVRTVLLSAAAIWLVQAAVLAPQHAVVDDWRFYVFPPARLPDFIVGMLLGIALLRSDAAARWPLRGTSVELLAVTAVALSIYASPLLPLSLRFSAAVMPAWALAIYVFAARRGAISRLLEHPVLVRLGEVSFAFYLIHLAVIEVTSYVLGWHHPWFMLLTFGATLAASFALFHGIEQPLRVRLRRALRPAADASSVRRGLRDRSRSSNAGEQRGFHVQPREAV